MRARVSARTPPPLPRKIPPKMYPCGGIFSPSEGLFLHMGTFFHVRAFFFLYRAIFSMCGAFFLLMGGGGFLGLTSLHKFLPAAMLLYITISEEKQNSQQFIIHFIHCTWPVYTDIHCTITIYSYSMCSLVVSTLDSPAVGRSSNPGSGKILMSENLRLYTTSPVVIC